MAVVPASSLSRSNEASCCFGAPSATAAGGGTTNSSTTSSPERSPVLLTLSKVSSKIAKFHLQIVENRLQFRSKILPDVHLRNHAVQLILWLAPGVSNEGRSSPLLVPLPPFLGSGFRLGARWNRLVETVKTRKKREKTGGNGRNMV
eukprot:COSAG04_NODE_1793_length_5565_cov_52.214782_4_plen_147_part_00